MRLIGFRFPRYTDGARCVTRIISSPDASQREAPRRGNKVDHGRGDAAADLGPERPRVRRRKLSRVQGVSDETTTASDLARSSPTASRQRRLPRPHCRERMTGVLSHDCCKIAPSNKRMELTKRPRLPRGWRATLYVTGLPPTLEMLLTGRRPSWSFCPYGDG
jgi:hypothetical protein